MKINTKFFVEMVVALAAFCVTLASGTVTTFKTGPFSVSVDLGLVTGLIPAILMAGYSP